MIEAFNTWFWRKTLQKKADKKKKKYKTKQYLYLRMNERKREKHGQDIYNEKQ